MKFNDDGVIDSVELPPSTMYNRDSFTISVWLNISRF